MDYLLAKLTRFTKRGYLPDFKVFSLAWLSDDTSTGNWNPAYDISEPADSVIDEKDLGVFCDNWLIGTD